MPQLGASQGAPGSSFSSRWSHREQNTTAGGTSQWGPRQRGLQPPGSPSGCQCIREWGAFQRESGLRTPLLSLPTPAVHAPERPNSLSRLLQPPPASSSKPLGCGRSSETDFASWKSSAVPSLRWKVPGWMLGSFQGSSCNKTLPGCKKKISPGSSPSGALGF